MVRYRQKPLVVGAELYKNESEGFPGRCNCDVVPLHAHLHQANSILIPTIGDWIVMSTGQYSICKAEDFASLYEPI